MHEQVLEIGGGLLGGKDCSGRGTDRFLGEGGVPGLRADDSGCGELRICRGEKRRRTRGGAGPGLGEDPLPEIVQDPARDPHLVGIAGVNLDLHGLPEDRGHPVGDVFYDLSGAGVAHIQDPFPHVQGDQTADLPGPAFFVAVDHEFQSRLDRPDLLLCRDKDSVGPGKARNLAHPVQVSGEGPALHHPSRRDREVLLHEPVLLFRSSVKSGTVHPVGQVPPPDGVRKTGGDTVQGLGGNADPEELSSDPCRPHVESPLGEVGDHGREKGGFFGGWRRVEPPGDVCGDVSPDLLPFVVPLDPDREFDGRGKDCPWSPSGDR